MAEPSSGGGWAQLGLIGAWITAALAALGSLATWLKVQNERVQGDRKLGLDESSANAEIGAELRDELRTDIKQLRDDLKLLKGRVSQLETDLALAQQEAREARAEAAEKAREIEGLRATLATLTIERADMSAEILRLQQDMAQRTGERDAAIRRAEEAEARIADLERRLNEEQG